MGRSTGLEGRSTIERPQLWPRAGRLFCLGWWLGAYVMTLNLQGWIVTELATLRTGRLSFTEMLADRATFGHCPLYFSLSWIIQKIFGESPVALRFPSAVFGLLCALVVARLVGRWASAGAAVFTGLIVLVNPLLLAVSQQARPYALALLFGLIATEIMVSPREYRGHSRAIFFGTVSLLGLLTSHSYWFVLGAQAIVFAFQARRRMTMVVAAAAASVGAVPWFLYAKYWAESGGASERFLTWMGPVDILTSLALPGRVSGLVPIGPDTEALLIVATTFVAVILSAVGITTLPRRVETSGPAAVRPTLIALWTAPPLAALAAGLLGWGNLLLLPRYFVVTATVQLILIAGAALSVQPSIRPVAMVLLAGCLAGNSLLYLGDVGGDEIRRSARIIEANRTDQEAVIIIATRNDVKRLKYYLSPRVISCFIGEPPATDRADLEQSFPRYRGRRHGVWIRVPREPDAPVAWTRAGTFEIADYLDSLRQRYRQEQAFEIGDSMLYHFRVR